MSEHRSLSKQELISAATKVDANQRFYIGVAREKQKRYAKAAEEGDPMCRWSLEMRVSQKEGLNEVIGSIIEICGKQITPDVMIQALSDWLTGRLAK